MSTKPQVNRLLMTGAAGGLGKAMRERLKENCNILRLSSRSDLGKAGPKEEIIYGDLSDKKKVEEMCDGVDAVFHLGGISTEKPWKLILEGNIVGMYNLYEAARKKKVKRILFASSNHAIGFYPRNVKIDTDCPPRPDCMYGVSKVFGEALARFYFDRYGIETACLRIGSSFPEPQNRRMLATWLSYDDLHRMVTQCLKVPNLGFAVIYGVSNNKEQWWDNSKVSYIGFVPQDSSEPFREKLESTTDPEDPTIPATIFMGGKFCSEGPFED